MTMGHIDCSNARPLVPSYLDGELSEAQAGPLRRHLLDCQACRAGAQSGKNLARWFAASEPVAVPRDFAARVARLAFQGGTVVAAPTISDFELLPAAPPLVRPAARAGRDARNENRDEAKILKFVMRMTVAAALVALLASVAIQSLRRPSTAELRADDRPTLSLEQAVEQLKLINAQAATTPVSAPHDRQP